MSRRSSTLAKVRIDHLAPSPRARCVEIIYCMLGSNAHIKARFPSSQDEIVSSTGAAMAASKFGFLSQVTFPDAQGGNIVADGLRIGPEHFRTRQAQAQKTL